MAVNYSESSLPRPHSRFLPDREASRRWSRQSLSDSVLAFFAPAIVPPRKIVI